jgi:hypothetical protein
MHLHYCFTTPTIAIHNPTFNITIAITTISKYPLSPQPPPPFITRSFGRRWEDLVVMMLVGMVVVGLIGVSLLLMLLSATVQ